MNERGKATVTLRPMTAADVSFAMELKDLAGWNQTAGDWRGYLDYEPDGCFIAETAGRPAGTVTTIRYADRIGWIGMVLVHPAQRRLGLGTKLLRHAIDYLQRRGTRCIKLDATPLGKNVYGPLGFREDYDLARYEGIAPGMDAGPGESIAPLTARDLPEVIAFDAPGFGAERAAVLRAMSARNPELCFVARDAAGVSGYVIARAGQNALQLGPWVAREGGTAERLLRAFFARAAGRRVFVDVPQPNAAGGALMEKYGFAVQRGFTRMHLGEDGHPGIPRQVFGTSSAEKG